MKLVPSSDEAAPKPSDEVALASEDGANFGLLVRYTFRSFTRILQTVVAPYAITAAEFRVLRTLATGGALTQVQIASLAGMDRPYAALAVKQLREKGLIQTRADETDRRRVGLILSPRGLEVATSISDKLADVNRACITGIPAKHIAIFSDVSVRMRENLDALIAEFGAPD